uniref:Uncharacterized protein n=1 Tax=Echinococcus granulosus TaxID=6210 RepID=A0A068WUB9_ECHGR|nr:hypothetical protein EgrG_002045200 [Echinococcus granulosus]
MGRRDDCPRADHVCHAPCEEHGQRRARKEEAEEAEEADLLRTSNAQVPFHINDSSSLSAPQMTALHPPNHPHTRSPQSSRHCRHGDCGCGGRSPTDCYSSTRPLPRLDSPHIEPSIQFSSQPTSVAWHYRDDDIKNMDVISSWLCRRRSTHELELNAQISRAHSFTSPFSSFHPSHLSHPLIFQLCSSANTSSASEVSNHLTHLYTIHSGYSYTFASIPRLIHWDFTRPMMVRCCARVNAHFNTSNTLNIQAIAEWERMHGSLPAYLYRLRQHSPQKGLSIRLVIAGGSASIRVSCALSLHCHLAFSLARSQPPCCVGTQHAESNPASAGLSTPRIFASLNGQAGSSDNASPWRTSTECPASGLPRAASTFTLMTGVEDETGSENTSAIMESTVVVSLECLPAGFRTQHASISATTHRPQHCMSPPQSVNNSTKKRGVWFGTCRGEEEMVANVAQSLVNINGPPAPHVPDIPILPSISLASTITFAQETFTFYHFPDDTILCAFIPTALSDGCAQTIPCCPQCPHILLPPALITSLTCLTAFIRPCVHPTTSSTTSCDPPEKHQDTSDILTVSALSPDRGSCATCAHATTSTVECVETSRLALSCSVLPRLVSPCLTSSCLARFVCVNTHKATKCITRGKQTRCWVKDNFLVVSLVDALGRC